MTMNKKLITPKVRDTLYSVIAAALAMTMVAVNAEAQSTRSGGGDARMQQALQQLTNEKARLQAENATLKKDAEEAARLRKANEKLEQELEYAQKKLSRTETNNEALTSSLDATRTRLDEVIEKYRELATDFRDNEIELAQTNAVLSRRNQALVTCADSNDAIAIIANDALDRYQGKGFFSKASEAEPFTGIARARVANLVEEYRYEIDDLRLADDIVADVADIAPAAGDPAESADEGS